MDTPRLTLSPMPGLAWVGFCVCGSRRLRTPVGRFSRRTNWVCIPPAGAWDAFLTPVHIVSHFRWDHKTLYHFSPFSLYASSLRTFSSVLYLSRFAYLSQRLDYRSTSPAFYRSSLPHNSLPSSLRDMDMHINVLLRLPALWVLFILTARFLSQLPAIFSCIFCHTWTTLPYPKGHFGFRGLWTPGTRTPFLPQVSLSHPGFTSLWFLTAHSVPYAPPGTLITLCLAA